MNDGRLPFLVEACSVNWLTTSTSPPVSATGQVHFPLAIRRKSSSWPLWLPANARRPPCRPRPHLTTRANPRRSAQSPGRPPPPPLPAPVGSPLAWPHHGRPHPTLQVFVESLAGKVLPASPFFATPWNRQAGRASRGVLWIGSQSRWPGRCSNTQGCHDPRPRAGGIRHNNRRFRNLPPSLPRQAAATVTSHETNHHPSAGRGPLSFPAGVTRRPRNARSCGHPMARRRGARGTHAVREGRPAARNCSSIRRPRAPPS